MLNTLDLCKINYFKGKLLQTHIVSKINTKAHENLGI